MKIYSIQWKIISLIAGSVFITTVILLFTLSLQKKNIEAKIDTNIDSMIHNVSITSAESVYLLCLSSHDRTIRRLDYNLKAAHDELKQNGDISFEGSIKWTTINQIDKKTSEIDLHKMLLGGKWLGQNYDSNIESVVVDKVKHFTRDACTIFQRMNEEGDMLRVCTSVIGADGKRAVGTYIPHKNPDGTSNPVINSVLEGKTYHGRAFVVSEWCSTAYEPLWDSPQKNKVIGMLYIGVGMDSVNKELKAAIIKTKVGKSGYVFIIGTKGDQKGKYIISKNSERDGEYIYESKDNDGKYFIKSIIEKALTIRNGTIDFERYSWKNKDESNARTKLSAITYFEPWDWVICSGIYEDDYREIKDETFSLLNKVVRYSVICSIIIFISIYIIALFIIRNITSPIKKSAQQLNLFAKGDFSQNITYDISKRKDELGIIAKAIQELYQNIGEIVKGIKTNITTLSVSSEELSSVSTQLASSADQMNNQSNIAASSQLQISTSIKTIADASKQSNILASNIVQKTKTMSLTFNEVAKNTAKTSENVSEVAVSGDNMIDSITTITTTVEELTKSLNEVAKNTINASRISKNANNRATDINTKMDALVKASKQIGKAVKVIKAIADKTDMLALNATIEAAGAGEYGKGFAVVAGEVKELARQSNDATEEIAILIEQIQLSTNEAVQAIDEINKIIDNIANINETIVSSVEEQLSTSREISKFAANSAELVKKMANNADTSASLVNNISDSMEDVSKTSQEVLNDINELLNEIKDVSISISEASKGSQNVAMNIEGISEDAKHVSIGANKTNASSKELAKMANDLALVISRFKI